MRPSNVRRTLVALFYLAASAACQAAPYELTVYSDDIPEHGEAEAELIFSVAKPRPDDDVPYRRIYQGLFEYTYGVAPGWAIGVEIPLAHADGSTRIKGLKAEVQYLAPHDEAHGAYWGFRSDIGYEGSLYETQGSHSIDLNPIIGYRWSSWHAVVNPSLEIPLTGSNRKTEFLPAAKLLNSVSSSSALGLEYYADLGPLSKIAPHNRRDEMLYLVWETRNGGRHWSFGIGEPLKQNNAIADKLVLKAGLSLELD